MPRRQTHPSNWKKQSHSWNEKPPQNPFVTDELHKQPICRIMQGDTQVPTRSGLHAAVQSFKVCKDNLEQVVEAINAENQIITGTLQKIRYGSDDKYSFVDPTTGMCMLNRTNVRCRPLLTDMNIVKLYFDSVKELNGTYSNVKLPEHVFALMDSNAHPIELDSPQHLISSMGLVPNKRMTDQSGFNRQCEFGSVSHELKSSDPAICLLGSSLNQSTYEAIGTHYVKHPFYSQYITEALCNLSIQAVKTPSVPLPDHMKNPVIEEARRQAPVVLHTGHATVTIYKSTHSIIHEFQNGINYGIPTMSAVFKTVADVHITTVTCTPYTANKSTGYLSRALNPACKEHIMSQHVNYTCTYHDAQKAHLPDVDLKMITVNCGYEKPETVSAVVHELGNGPAVQYDIHNPVFNGRSFFGFGISIASEVIHQSIVNALHNMVVKFNPINLKDRNVNNLFGAWRSDHQLNELLVNLRKNIIPWNKNTDDPADVYGKRLDASFSTRECGLIAYGSEDRDPGRLHRAELVVVISPVARPFGTDGLNLWIPTWDVVITTGGRGGRGSPTPSVFNYIQGNATFSAPSSCGMDMCDIMYMASQPSEFDP